MMRKQQEQFRISKQVDHSIHDRVRAVEGLMWKRIRYIKTTDINYISQINKYRTAMRLIEEQMR